MPGFPATAAHYFSLGVTKMVLVFRLDWLSSTKMQKTWFAENDNFNDLIKILPGTQQINSSWKIILKPKRKTKLTNLDNHEKMNFYQQIDQQQKTRKSKSTHLDKHEKMNFYQRID